MATELNSYLFQDCEWAKIDKNPRFKIFILSLISGIRIIILSGAICLPHGLLFYYKNSTKHVGLVQNRHYHHLVKNNLFLACYCYWYFPPISGALPTGSNLCKSENCSIGIKQ